MASFTPIYSTGDDWDSDEPSGAIRTDIITRFETIKQGDAWSVYVYTDNYDNFRASPLFDSKDEALTFMENIITGINETS